jgi:GMP synthase-like glutamine amidotransferase
LHELHKKEIATMVPGFLALAEDNQCCLSESNTILTFQGHPEMSEKMARLLVQGESMYTEGLGEGEVKSLVERAGEEHDGVEVWRRVLEWVGE